MVPRQRHYKQSSSDDMGEDGAKAFLILVMAPIVIVVVVTLLSELAKAG